MHLCSHRNKKALSLSVNLDNALRNLFRTTTFCIVTNIDDYGNNVKLSNTSLQVCENALW